MLPIKNIVQCEATKHAFTKLITPNQRFMRLDNEWRSIEATEAVGSAVTDSIKNILKARSVDLKIIPFKDKV